LALNGKNKKFLVLNAKRLEIKLRAQRGMTLIILTFTYIMPVEIRFFFGRKNGIENLVKNAPISSGFSIVT